MRHMPAAHKRLTLVANIALAFAPLIRLPRLPAPMTYRFLLPIQAAKACQTAVPAIGVQTSKTVGLVNLVEDRHHRLLNNLVLQRCDAQRAFPPISLRYIDSS